MTAEQQATIDTIKTIIAAMESQHRSLDMMMQTVKDMAAVMDSRISNIEAVLQEAGMAQMVSRESMQ